MRRQAAAVAAILFLLCSSLNAQEVATVNWDVISFDTDSFGRHTFLMEAVGTLELVGEEYPQFEVHFYVTPPGQPRIELGTVSGTPDDVFFVYDTWQTGYNPPVGDYVFGVEVRTPSNSTGLMVRRDDDTIVINPDDEL